MSRNTRAVFPIRLSDSERAQIAGAAERQQLPVGQFVRQAALHASALVTRKARVKAEASPEPELHELVVADPEPAEHYVDGELVQHRVEGVLVDSGLRPIGHQ